MVKASWKLTILTETRDTAEAKVTLHESVWGSWRSNFTCLIGVTNTPVPNINVTGTA